MEVNKNRLFLASCIALIVTAMSFAIRGDIMGDLETVFTLDKTQLGVIGGAAFFSFGLAIFIGGSLCDLLGMGALLYLAGACHIGGTILTIFAPSYTVVVVATLLVGIGNGLVEAVCNPLIATIFPDKKTQKLTLFHAWFPGGIVIGGVACFVLGRMGLEMGTALGWKVKMALLLLPAIVYMGMLIGQKFPATERVASGVPFSEMFLEAVRRPLFWIIFICMWLTAATELGPGTWIANIYKDVMGDTAGAGILLLVWGSGLMWVLRQFCSGIAHKMTPVSLIACTAPFAAVGLWMCSQATTPVMWFVASGLLYFGVCFWWPTMLGITSERMPKTGALGLAIIGGTGCFSTSLASPIMGWINEKYGAEKVLAYWAVLPVALVVIFGWIYLSDKAKGGYQVEELETGNDNE